MSALTARLEEAQQLFESGDVLEAAGVLTQLATEAKGDPQTLAEIARKRREMRARIAPADLFDFEVAAGLRRSGSSAGRVVGGLLAILLLPLYVGIITFVAGYSSRSPTRKNFSSSWPSSASQRLSARAWQHWPSRCRDHLACASLPGFS